MRIRVTVLILALSLAGVATIVSAAVADSSARAADKFRITRIVTPTNLVANGPDRSERIYWAGSPKFPVKAREEPRSCPAGLICKPISRTFTVHRDPLVWPKAWHCQGVVPAGFEFKYETWLVDAAGKQTAKVSINVPCRSS
jgi:hypothetical protein